MSDQLKSIAVDDVLNAIDAYADARQELKEAAAECYASNGVVIHDVIWQAKKQVEDARATLRVALLALVAS
jgi:hypothetical protein